MAFLGNLANSLSCCGLKEHFALLAAPLCSLRLDPFDPRLPFSRVLLVPPLTGICRVRGTNDPTRAVSETIVDNVPCIDWNSLR